MKKLVIILSLLGAVISASPQSSGTIVDNGTNVVITYADGQRYGLFKGNQVFTYFENTSSDEVFLMTNHRWWPGKITKILSLKVSEFGYSTPSELATFLDNILSDRYVQFTVYSGDDQDSIIYANPVDSTYLHGFKLGWLNGKEISAKPYTYDQ